MLWILCWTTHRCMCFKNFFFCCCFVLLSNVQSKCNTWIWWNISLLSGGICRILQSFTALKLRPCKFSLICINVRVPRPHLIIQSATDAQNQVPPYTFSFSFTLSQYNITIRPLLQPETVPVRWYSRDERWLFRNVLLLNAVIDQSEV